MPSEKRGGNYPKFPCGHKQVVGNLVMKDGETACRACEMMAERGKGNLRHQPSKSGIIAPRTYRQQIAFDSLLLAGQVRK